MTEYDIRSVTFEDDAIAIQFMASTDVRVKGLMMQTRVAYLNMRHPDYREDAEALLAKVQRVLRNALEDFEESEPYEPPLDDDDDDDEELGMGHG